MADGEDNFEPSKYISIVQKIDDSNSLLLRLTVKLYASKEICSILAEDLANSRFAMRSLIYINDHINL